VDFRRWAECTILGGSVDRGPSVTRKKFQGCLAFHSVKILRCVTLWIGGKVRGEGVLVGIFVGEGRCLDGKNS